jgi:hypothetical protein
MFKDSTDLLIIRDFTMMLLSFSGFLRYDEISSLRFNKRDCNFSSLYMALVLCVFLSRTAGCRQIDICVLFIILPYTWEYR